MPKYRVFNKLHEKGKPVGRQFLYGTFTAKNAEAAKRKVQRKYNSPWNKSPENKRQNLTVKVVKVAKVKKREK